MIRSFFEWAGARLRTPGRYYAYGSAFILAVVVYAISAQLTDRAGFANSTLRDDVIERWGAPIVQSAPSVRYVESGSVFSTLTPLPLERQRVKVDAQMSYRKRGLVYFSGFEFEFSGSYRVANPHPHAIDVVFVLPVVQARRSMLRDLRFSVDGEPAALPLDDDGQEKLVWTGRLEPGAQRSFEIAFAGRGLDSFVYVTDPALPVRDFGLAIEIRGDSNYDYAPGVVPATSLESGDDGVSLAWSFASLESGFPFGVIVPTEESFDAIILTMIRRSWATFGLFLLALIALGTHHERGLSRLETYLTSAGFAFFYVLLPYLAAYMHFYLAYALAAAISGGLLFTYLSRIWAGAHATVGLAIAGLLVVPTLAVVLERHTGLIYTLEILAALGLGMAVSLRPAVQELSQRLEASLLEDEEIDHV